MHQWQLMLPVSQLIERPVKNQSKSTNSGHSA
jgi:hypothetical protein